MVGQLINIKSGQSVFLKKPIPRFWKASFCWKQNQIWLVKFSQNERSWNHDSTIFWTEKFSRLKNTSIIFVKVLTYIYFIKQWKKGKFHLAIASKFHSIFVSYWMLNRKKRCLAPSNGTYLKSKITWPA